MYGEGRLVVVWWWSVVVEVVVPDSLDKRKALSFERV